MIKIIALVTEDVNIRVATVDFDIEATDYTYAPILPIPAEKIEMGDKQGEYIITVGGQPRVTAPGNMKAIFEVV